MPDLNAHDLEAGDARSIEGTARSMGIEVVGGLAWRSTSKRYRKAATEADRRARSRYQRRARRSSSSKEMRASRSSTRRVDIAVRLGVDPRHADQMVRGTVVLPHGTGKTVRVLVFAKGDKEKEARGGGRRFRRRRRAHQEDHRKAGSTSTS